MLYLYSLNGVIENEVNDANKIFYFWYNYNADFLQN